MIYNVKASGGCALGDGVDHERLFRPWRMVAAGTLDLDALGVRTVGLHDPAGALDLAEATSGPEFVALVP